MVGTSMDAIAEASSVSKATIYNHWADKDALCLEALGRLYGLDETPPDFDTGSLREDLVALIRYRPAAHREALQQQIMPHLMVYASQNRPFGDAWRKQVLTRPRARFARRLKVAVDRGELDGGSSHRIRHRDADRHDGVPRRVQERAWRVARRHARTSGRRVLPRVPARPPLACSPSIAAAHPSYVEESRRERNRDEDLRSGRRVRPSQRRRRSE